MANYKKPCSAMYHIFSNDFDEYEKDIERVFELLQALLEDEAEDIRIYKQEIWDEKEGVFDEGNCIFSLGQWPQ